MSKVRTIAWREFRQTVFRPVFLLAIIGIPVGIMVVLGLAGYLMATQEEPALVGTIALVDGNGELTDALRSELEPKSIEADQHRKLEQMQEQSVEQLRSGGAPGQFAITPNDMTAAFQRGEVNITVDQIDPASESYDEGDLKQLVREQKILAAVIVPEHLLEPNLTDRDDAEAESEDDAQERATSFDLFVAPNVDNDHVSLIEDRVGQAVVRVRASRAGLDPQRTLAMFKAPRSATRRMLESGEDTSETEVMRELKQMIPLVFMVLLWVGVFTAGQHLLMSTIEEKSNRVMEVLLSAVSPMQLMVGKIFGHGAVGLLITGIYASVGIAALIAFAAMKFIEPMSLLYLGIYFFMAYFMIASLMAAVGSAVSDIREANTLMTPVMLIVMIPWFLWMPIIQAPNGPLAQAFSWIPPMTPFVMILRVSADEPVPYWQIPATIIWGYVCVVAMMWIAAKIFRVGVLMYGKPPSPLQLIKWLRYS